jgi:TorA maturation chaperone TorD
MNDAGTLTPSPEDLLRARVYGVLASLLGRPPSAQMLATLRSIPATGAEDADALGVAWTALAGAAHETEPEQAAREYQDLFIGLGRGELVPFGSWYRTGYLMEQPLAELREDLRRLGFERSEQSREPEDHAAALCEVMALLCGIDQAADCESDAAARADDLATQRAFFETHMAPWMRAFFNDLKGASGARFYAAVGQLGDAFMELEQRCLSMPV